MWHLPFSEWDDFGESEVSLTPVFMCLGPRSFVWEVTKFQHAGSHSDPRRRCCAFAKPWVTASPLWRKPPWNYWGFRYRKSLLGHCVRPHLVSQQVRIPGLHAPGLWKTTSLQIIWEKLFFFLVPSKLLINPCTWIVLLKEFWHLSSMWSLRMGQFRLDVGT